MIYLYSCPFYIIKKDKLPQIKIIFHFFWKGGEIKNNPSEISKNTFLFFKNHEFQGILQITACPFLGHEKVKKGNFWGNFG